MPSQRATIQQLKLIMLLEDLTGERTLWNRRRRLERVRLAISARRAGSRIAELVELADRLGVPTYKYKPFKVRRWISGDDPPFY